MSGFTLTFADASDLAEVKAINEQCLTENYSADIYTQLRSSTIVCRETGKSKIVGYVMMANLAVQDEYLLPFSWRGGERSVYTSVFSLAVLPEFRNKRIAQRLLKVIVDSHSKHPIILRARKSNLVACHIYTKLGFKIFKETPDYYTNPDESAYVFIRTKNKQLNKLFTWKPTDAC